MELTTPWWKVKSIVELQRLGGGFCQINSHVAVTIFSFILYRTEILTVDIDVLISFFSLGQTML